MSRQTPRKKGQQHNNSHSNQHETPQHQHKRNRSQHLQPQYQQNLPSDYESDIATYMSHHPPPPPAALASRTNTDLNMKVLRRYVPGVHSILSIAANAVMYEIQLKEDGNYGWDKLGIEGTMFVCAQTSPGQAPDDPAWDGTKGCVFILNRKGIMNQTLELAEVESIETSDQLLTFKMEDKRLEDLPKVLGLYIHADEASTRTTNAALIQEMWSKLRRA